MKQRTLAGFGRRLAELRRRRGLSQRELGQAVGVSKRVIVYYESVGAQPPGAMLVDLARALEVSTDELLGIRALRELPRPKTARLWKRFRQVEELAPADQRAVFKMIDALIETQRRAAPKRAKSPAHPKRNVH